MARKKNNYIGFWIEDEEKHRLLEEMEKDGFEDLSHYLRAIIRKVID